MTSPSRGATADTTGPAGHDQPDLPPRPRSAVTTGTLDLLGILAASQALSSETSLERLHARVVDVLGALTGATAVHLLLWDQERQDWLPHPRGKASRKRHAHQLLVPRGQQPLSGRELSLRPIPEPSPAPHARAGWQLRPAWSR
jgi:hypothetical protein